MAFTTSRFFLALSALFVLSSCDEIALPDNASFAYREDLYGAPANPPAIASFNQRVLLEDFTGQQCGNCPEAHAVGASILEDHESEVALVAVHAGSLAGVFGPYVNDWTTPEGTFYLLGQIGSDQLPTGRINRNGGATLSNNFAQWSGLVEAELATTPAAEISLSAELIADNNHLNLHIRSLFAEAVSGPIKLVIMITEGPIVAPQLNYDADPEFIPDYIHKHMLRGTGTGATGLTVATNPSAGSEVITHYTLDWNSEWNAANVELIAFLTAGESGEVINVQKLDLIP